MSAKASARPCTSHIRSHHSACRRPHRCSRITAAAAAYLGTQNGACDSTNRRSHVWIGRARIGHLLARRRTHGSTHRCSRSTATATADLVTNNAAGSRANRSTHRCRSA